MTPAYKPVSGRSREEVQIFIGKADGAEVAAEEDVAGGNATAFDRHDVVEGDEAAADVGYMRGDDHMVVKAGRADIAAMRLGYGEKYAVFDFHFAVAETDRLAVFHAGHFHPDQIVGVIDDAHLIGFGIADADGCDVRRHRLQIVAGGLMAESVKLPVVSATMHIRVLFFGLLKDVCGRSEDALELPAGATAGSVFDHYAEAIPKLRGMAASIVLARNQEFAKRVDPLADGDEVALLPPVSGGAPSGRDSSHEITDDAGHYFAITRDVIDPRALEARVLEGCDGALVTFQGVVRNNTKGRATLRLEYECYEAMAVRKMAEIGREIAGQFAVGRIAMVHRLGVLEIGEASVMVVVAAPHRRPAFEAALEGINRLKKLVPVWKKEFFEDGEVWVEGEWDQGAPRAAGN